MVVTEGAHMEATNEFSAPRAPIRDRSARSNKPHDARIGRSPLARIRRALTPFTLSPADIDCGEIDIESDLRYGRD